MTQFERKASSPPRLEWLDFARGVCIFLVVLYHTVNLHYLSLPNMDAPWAAHWEGLGYILRPIRMPLFFLLSGLLASNAVLRPWRDGMRKRVASNAYLYTIWISFSLALLPAAPHVGEGVAPNSFADFLSRYLLPFSTLWYIYALGVYFVMAKLLARLPTAVSLAIGVLISLVPSLSSWSAPQMVGPLLQNFVFFFCGIACSFRIKAFADSITLIRLLFAVGACLLALIVNVILQTAKLQNFPGLTIITAVSAFPIAIQLSVLVSRSKLGIQVSRIGRNTLPVYLLHIPLLAVLDIFASGSALPLFRLVHGPIGTIYPLLISVAVTVASLLAHRALIRVKAAFLFEAP